MHLQLQIMLSACKNLLKGRTGCESKKIFNSVFISELCEIANF